MLVVYYMLIVCGDGEKVEFGGVLRMWVFILSFGF